MNQENLNILFKSDKSDWFLKSEKGVKEWDPAKISNFWNLIRIHKIEKADFSFDGFIFPSFSKSEEQKLDPTNNFYNDTFGSQNEVINSTVSFRNCTFQGNTFFLGKITGIDEKWRKEIIFAKQLIFSNCKFEEEFRLSAVKVFGSINISECEFYKKSSINSSIFKATTSINSCTFKDDFMYYANTHFGKTNFGANIYFAKSEFLFSFFNDIVSFNGCKFNGNAKFNTNTYNKSSDISNIEFNQKSSHIGEKYYSHRFIRAAFSQTNHTFENIALAPSKQLTFQAIIFNKSIAFKKCDCSQIFFTDSDISDLNFSSCNWKTNYRLLMKDELDNKVKNREDYLNLENLYRQLKKIFEGNKEWELSGKAYVSEMYIRKKRLWIEREYVSWLIFSFYDFFGGFTQDYIKPLKWYILFTFVIFPLYYLNFDCSQKTWLIKQLSFCDLEQAFQKSIASSFPFINTNLIYENWWIKAIQTFICGILLTFFILALRKRFKQ